MDPAQEAVVREQQAPHDSEESHDEISDRPSVQTPSPAGSMREHLESDSEDKENNQGQNFYHVPRNPLVDLTNQESMVSHPVVETPENSCVQCGSAFETYTDLEEHRRNSGHI